MKTNKITTKQMELLVYDFFEKSSLVVVPRFDAMNGCYYEDKTSIRQKTNRYNELIGEEWILKKYKSPKNNNLASPIDDKQLNIMFRIGYLKYWFHRRRTEKEEKKVGWF